MTEYDVAIHNSGNGSLVLRVPSTVARAMAARGYTRAKLTVSPDGLIFKPYVAEAGRRRSDPIDLPEWESA